MNGGVVVPDMGHDHPMGQDLATVARQGRGSLNSFGVRASRRLPSKTSWRPRSIRSSPTIRSSSSTMVAEITRESAARSFRAWNAALSSTVVHWLVLAALTVFVLRTCVRSRATRARSGRSRRTHHHDCGRGLTC